MASDPTKSPCAVAIVAMMKHIEDNQETMWPLLEADMKSRGEPVIFLPGSVFPKELESAMNAGCTLSQIPDQREGYLFTDGEGESGCVVYHEEVNGEKGVVIDCREYQNYPPPS